MLHVRSAVDSDSWVRELSGSVPQSARLTRPLDSGRISKKNIPTSHRSQSSLAQAWLKPLWLEVPSRLAGPRPGTCPWPSASPPA
eukprot:53799-Pyramimonas_sp.AAC.1